MIAITDTAIHTRLARLKAFARLLDEAIEIPGFGVRFGLDAIVGLIPGFGDVATACVSAWIVIESVRLGAPKSVQAKMLVNIAIDLVAGAVPIIGDIFDVGWKANVRNVKILERWLGLEG